MTERVMFPLLVLNHCRKREEQMLKIFNQLKGDKNHEN
jgi:hypothetical protein